MGGEPGLETPTPAPSEADAANGLWARVREHKIIQWGLAYLGAALALAHGAELLGHTFHWADFVGRTLMVGLVVGFPVALTLAWYHGHKGLTQISAGELSIVSVLLLLGALFFTAVFRPFEERVAGSSAHERSATPVPAVAAGSETAPLAEPAGVPPRSVAVLPFQNLSPDPNDAYFSAGIHEEILSQLSKLGSLNVISRTSVARYANTDLSIPQIAKELRVGAVMEGSVRYSNHRVRIAAQLIDGTSDRPLWSDVYERDLAEVFAIQAEIAMNIANAVGAEFSSAEREQLERPPTSSPEAYRLYLQSRELLSVQSPEAIRQGLLLRDRALELDPGFALARASKVVDLVSSLVDGTGPARRSGNRPSLMDREREAREEVARVLQSDPNLWLAHASLGMVDLYTWHWTESLEQSRLAAGRHRRADIVLQYVLLTAYMGNAGEGIRFAERALQADVNSVDAYQLLGIVHGYAHDFDAAVVNLQKAQELTPTNPLVSNWLAYMEIARGNEAEALARLQFSERILGGTLNLAFWSEFAYAYHRLGRRAEAERFHRDLVAASADLTLGAGTQAMMSLAVGDNEQALEWLDKAAEKARNHEIDEGFYALMNLKMNFTKDPLLNGPRFVEAFSKIRGD